MKFTEIANSLRDERREFIKTVVDATGVYHSTVLKWISGEMTPNARNRQIIAEALNTSVNTLFPEHENQPS